MRQKKKGEGRENMDIDIVFLLPVTEHVPQKPTWPLKNLNFLDFSSRKRG